MSEPKATTSTVRAGLATGSTTGSVVKGVATDPLALLAEATRARRAERDAIRAAFAVRRAAGLRRRHAEKLARDGPERYETARTAELPLPETKEDQ